MINMIPVMDKYNTEVTPMCNPPLEKNKGAE